MQRLPLILRLHLVQQPLSSHHVPVLISHISLHSITKTLSRAQRLAHRCCPMLVMLPKESVVHGKTSSTFVSHTPFDRSFRRNYEKRSLVQPKNSCKKNFFLIFADKNFMLSFLAADYTVNEHRNMTKIIMHECIRASKSAELLKPSRCSTPSFSSGDAFL